MSPVIRLILLASMLVIGLTACGLKGPLRLRDKPAPAAATPVPASNDSTHSSNNDKTSDDKKAEQPNTGSSDVSGAAGSRGK